MKLNIQNRTEGIGSVPAMTDRLVFMPTLPDVSPEGMPMKFRSLAPRRMESERSSERGSSATRRTNSLLGMLSVGSVCESATVAPITRKMGAGAGEIVARQSWPKMPKEDPQEKVAFTEPICRKEAVLKTYESPQAALFTANEIPNAPTPGGASRLELSVSPCATPQGNTAPAYRLPKREPGGPSLKGRYCLLLPQL